MAVELARSGGTVLLNGSRNSGNRQQVESRLQMRPGRHPHRLCTQTSNCTSPLNLLLVENRYIQGENMGRYIAMHHKKPM